MEWSKIRLSFLAVGIAALLGIATLGVSFAKSTSAQMAWDGDGWGGSGASYHMSELPPQLAFLKQIPPDQRFDHFRGATVSLVDEQGNTVTINATPGTVASVSSQALSMTPNGETTERSFSITGDTQVLAVPPAGSIQAINQGDKVIVVTVGQDQSAAMIVKVPPLPQKPGQAPAQPTPTPGSS